MILSKSKMNNVSTSVFFYLLSRVLNITLPTVLSQRFLPIEQASTLTPLVAVFLAVFSAIFGMISIIEYHKEIYKILKYEKYYSVLISGIIGVFSEIL
jgi:hypothetical protein